MQALVLPHDEQAEVAEEAEAFNERQGEVSTSAASSGPDPLELLLYDEVISSWSPFPCFPDVATTKKLRFVEGHGQTFPLEEHPWIIMS